MRSEHEIGRFLAIQIGLGFAVATAFATIAVATDIGGIRSLIEASGDRGALLVFLVGAVTTFVPLVVATGVGVLAQEGD
jgi:hypothetical protein